MAKCIKCGNSYSRWSVLFSNLCSDCLKKKQIAKEKEWQEEEKEKKEELKYGFSVKKIKSSIKNGKIPKIIDLNPNSEGYSPIHNFSYGGEFVFYYEIIKNIRIITKAPFMELSKTYMDFLNSYKLKHYEVVEILIGINKGNLNRKTYDERTPLMFAVECNMSKLLNFLLDYDVDVNIKNKIGKTALHYAVCTRNIDAVRQLISKGSNTNEQDIYGATPLQWAEVIEDIEIIKYIKNNGGKLLQTDKTQCRKFSSEFKKPKNISPMSQGGAINILNNSTSVMHISVHIGRQLKSDLGLKVDSFGFPTLTEIHQIYEKIALEQLLFHLESSQK